MATADPPNVLRHAAIVAHLLVGCLQTSNNPFLKLRNFSGFLSSSFFSTFSVSYLGENTPLTGSFTKSSVATPRIMPVIPIKLKLCLHPILSIIKIVREDRAMPT